MIKTLESKNKNFDSELHKLLLRRKNKIQDSSVSVTNIIKDVKKNGDKALLRYEKKFNKNSIIVPTSKQIAKSIKTLDKNVKQAIDKAYNRIYKFHSLQKFNNISYTDEEKQLSSTYVDFVNKGPAEGYLKLIFDYRDGLLPRSAVTFYYSNDYSSWVQIGSKHTNGYIIELKENNSFFEVGKNYGLSVITGLARLDGHPIILIANNPQVYGGGWTSNSSKKIIKILDLAQTFHFPVLHLIDNPGFVIGTHAEKDATIRYGSRALAAIYQLNVPICSIILRKAFGVAGAAHTNHTKHRYRFAWPSGDWGSLPKEGGIEAAYKSDLANSSNPDLLKSNIYKKLEQASSPFKTAEKFLIEDIIDPRETRQKICKWINLAYSIIKKGPSYFTYRP